MSDILIVLLVFICVESDKIPLLYELKQLYKCLPVGLLRTSRKTSHYRLKEHSYVIKKNLKLIDIACTANDILCKLYTKNGKMAVYF